MVPLDVQIAQLQRKIWEYGQEVSFLQESGKTNTNEYLDAVMNYEKSRMDLDKLYKSNGMMRI